MLRLKWIAMMCALLATAWVAAPALADDDDDDYDYKRDA